MKCRSFLILMINTVLLTIGCTRNHKTYYEDGKLKSIEERKNGNATVKQIKFDRNGDTTSINHYTNNLLNGISVLYSNDLGKTKRIYNYKNGKIEGTALEYVNDKLRFKWEYCNGQKDGDFLAYFNDGSLKAKGHYQSDTICFINEFDRLGNQINTFNQFYFAPQKNLNAPSELKIVLNFHKLNPFLKGKKAFYALFKTEGKDTMKITKTLKDSILLNENLISIPFRYKPSNHYFLKIALPYIENGQQNSIFYDLDFVIDSNSRVIGLDSCCYEKEFELKYSN